MRSSHMYFCRLLTWVSYSISKHWSGPFGTGAALDSAHMPRIDRESLARDLARTFRRSGAATAGPRKNASCWFTGSVLDLSQRMVSLVVRHNRDHPRRAFTADRFR